MDATVDRLGSSGCDPWSSSTEQPVAHAPAEHCAALHSSASWPRQSSVRHSCPAPQPQLVDFRSSEEHREDTAWSLMLSNGVIKTYDSYGAVVQVRQ